MPTVPAGWWALLAAVTTAVVVGLALRAREGRVRVRNTSGDSDVARPVSDQFPESLRQHLAARHDAPGRDHATETRVTLLQLSTTFCAPCRHTRILLSDFAERTAGVRHVEVDLTHHPEWSTPLGVHRTPTTLALDAAGHELFRVGGVPRRAQLDEALRPHLL